MHVAMDHFNTSHVTVYLATSKLTTPQDRFQYISCYGLSEGEVRVPNMLIVFQYISCYGLSVSNEARKRGKQQFQYISCYGLSFEFGCIVQKIYVFQYISCYGLSRPGS